ncbi:MerR family transcriptional regulator [Streptomyces sp. t39]|uniref:MerR family transcriptional regulator n=1 Tax=Streptomyces sp. t39 TaxID=1828156 RepID=UPI0011CEC2E8|nr:MerR family transcriptional regulator [Streptomyces sp. t39]TXS44467.1 MerR family transcriptional regulator [Streptomyces sp. t39]
MDGETGDGQQEAGLTTGEVARRLGVAPTTVRSWDRRYGLGPAGRVGGRHRRWTPADVALLERMCALTATGVPPAEAARLAQDRTRPSAPPRQPEPGDPPGRPAAASGRAHAGMRLGDARQECRGLARAALRLDAAALDELLNTAVETYGLVDAWHEILMPTLQAVGRKWESSGERYVEVEHFLSWHIACALRRAAPPVANGRPGGLVLLACVPGENHTLPLEALSAALAQRRIAVRMFGAALPVEALIEAVRRTGPAVVGLWAQSRTTASQPLAQHVAGMRWGVRGSRRQAAVMTLGPGWAGKPVGGTLRPPGLAEAVDAVEARVHG